jgi:hypothetical protein
MDASFDIITQSASVVNEYPIPAVSMPRELRAAEFAALPVSAAALERRRRIHALQASLISSVPGSEEGPTPVHLVVDGMYFRQLTIPAGMVVVSKRHAREHICTISRGSATVFTEDGITRVVAPYSFHSPAGCKRVLLVHEEIVWATVHRTELTDIAEIERDVMMDETLLLGETK